MRWDDILNALIELLKQNPGARIVCVKGYQLFPEGVGKTIIVLSYFNRKIGPSIFYSFPKKQLDKALSATIYDVMDQPSKEEFLTQSFDNVKLLNYYFQLNSEWARGKKEMVMVSLILDQQIPTEVEEKISQLCTEFSDQLQSNKEIFKAFYINDVNNFDEEDQKSIIKNESSIREWVMNLYWALIEATREKIEEDKIAFLLKNKRICLFFKEFVRNTILIIDNEPGGVNLTEKFLKLEDLTEKFLKLEDFETITCSSVNETLKLIEERYNDIAIIFLNPMMPGLNIYEFYQFIKSDERYKHISVISTEKSDGEGGDLPYPYVFKPPTPPGDLGLAGEPQTKRPITIDILKDKPYCKHCGAELPPGQAVCHVCGKKI